MKHLTKGEAYPTVNGFNVFWNGSSFDAGVDAPVDAFTALLPLGDMSNEDAGKLAKARAMGVVIQCWSFINRCWGDLRKDTHLQPQLVYRVKHEPTVAIHLTQGELSELVLGMVSSKVNDKLDDALKEF